MIAWSIEAARASGLFDHIVVSTDDAEIAELAIKMALLRSYGITREPAQMSHAPTWSPDLATDDEELLNPLAWLQLS